MNKRRINWMVWISWATIAVLVALVNPSFEEMWLICLTYAVGFHVGRRLL